MAACIGIGIAHNGDTACESSPHLLHVIIDIFGHFGAAPCCLLLSKFPERRHLRVQVMRQAVEPQLALLRTVNIELSIANIMYFLWIEDGT